MIYLDKALWTAAQRYGERCGERKLSKFLKHLEQSESARENTPFKTVTKNIESDLNFVLPKQGRKFEIFSFMIHHLIVAF